MANLPESSTFDAGVYQLELTDPVVGGPSGVSNAPLKNLANRTKYLKDHVDAIEAAYAPKASPAFTGNPTAPTPSIDDNDTSIATTAFVIGQAASVNPLMDGSAAVGTSTRFARADHVHPIDTSRAPTASPALTGTPTAPTAAVNTSTTQLATTAFVNAEIANDAAPISHVGSGGSDHSVATTSTAGFMSSSDKTKLDSVSSGAAALGSVTPAMNGSAAVGTATTAARSDHVHPSDTSKANATGGNASGTWPISITGNAATATLAENGGVTSIDSVTGAINLSSLAAFAKSLSGNGYQKLPGGLILQWGQNTYSGSPNSSQNFSLPISFPSNFFGIVTTCTNDLNSYPNISVVNLYTFNFRWGGGAGSYPTFNWIAVGK